MFIKFYNCFMENGDYKLTPRQWYFYSLLQMRKSYFLDCTETSIDIIVCQQTIFNHSRSSKNKESVKVVIDELRNIGVIEFTEKISQDKSQYSNILSITFRDLGNFEKITSDEFERATNPMELYALCVIKRFNKWGFSKKLDDWGDVLSCSRNTAVKVIKDMIDRGLITHEYGDLRKDQSGNYTSNPNTYYLGHTEENTQKDISVDMIHQEAANEIVVESKTEQRKNRWGVKGSKLTVDDFYILLTSEDDDFKKRNHNTYEKLRLKGGWFKDNVEKLMREAQAMIDNERQRLKANISEERKAKASEKLKSCVMDIFEKTCSNAYLIEGSDTPISVSEWDGKSRVVKVFYKMISTNKDEIDSNSYCVKISAYSVYNEEEIIDLEYYKELHKKALEWENEHSLVTDITPNAI